MKKLVISFCCMFFAVASVHAGSTNYPKNGNIINGSSAYNTETKDIEKLLQCNENQDIEYLIKKFWFGMYMYQYIDQKMKDENIVGASISVINGDDTLFTHGFGYADREKNIPVTPFTLFRVASITKIFTGIAIMQLVEKEMIDLDAPLNTYLPEFSVKARFPDTKPITIRMLMAHQSGLPEDKLMNSESKSYPPEDNRLLVDYLKDEYVAYPPEYISTYSNLAVSLLGIVIEEISGMTFNAYIEQKILKSIGMHASGMESEDYSLHPYLSKGYSASGDEHDFYYVRDAPTGGLLSSAFEMSRFMKMVLNGGSFHGTSILQTQTLDEMFEQQNDDIALDFPTEKGTKWGLSWVLSHRDNLFDYAGSYIGHNGYTQPFSSELHLLPEYGLGVMVSVNTDVAGPCAEIADEALIKALEIIKGVKKPDAPPLPEETALTAGMINQMTGIFAVAQEGTHTIVEEDGDLFLMTTLGSGRAQLIPHVDNWFSIEADGKRLEGHRISVQLLNNEKVIVQETRTQNGGIARRPCGVEIDISNAIPQAWKDRCGEYDVTMPGNPDVSDALPPASIIAIENNIIYSLSGEAVNAMVPVSDNEIVQRGMGRGANEVMQVKKIEGEEYLSYSGFLFKKREGGSEKEIKLQAPDNLTRLIK